MSFCAGGRRFAPQPWHYSRRNFSFSQATARFSTPNMPYILNLFKISLCGEAINYRQYASSFEIASHVKNYHFNHYSLFDCSTNADHKSGRLNKCPPHKWQNETMFLPPFLVFIISITARICFMAYLIITLITFSKFRIV